MASIEVDVKQLLEAGAHFGHKTSRWHPAMRPYIHSKRGENHVIDLFKTKEKLEIALAKIQDSVSHGGTVLLVSTKRQAKDFISELAQETGMPYVVNRWLGGMLTNTVTMGARIKHLKNLEEKKMTGELDAKYSKLEVQRFQEEIDQMNELYGGIKDMPGKPSVVFVVDVTHDKNAVLEAIKLKIPVVGLVDTNADPRTIDFPVPCNDDAVKTIKLVCDYVKQAIEAGKSAQKAPTTDAVTPVEKPIAKPAEATADKPAETSKEQVAEEVEPKETKKGE